MTALAICYVKTIPKVEVVYFCIEDWTIRQFDGTEYENKYFSPYDNNNYNVCTYTINKYDNFTLSDLFKTEYIHCITAKFLRETCLFCNKYLDFATITGLWENYITENITIYQSRIG